MSFKDKVVLVTGASSGIGAAIAIKFSEEGAKVAIVGRNEERLKITFDECKKSGGEPLLIGADVTEDDAVKRLMNDTIHHFGKLDVLVNNAGAGTRVAIDADNALEVFDRVHKTNLRSVIQITNLAVPHLAKTRGNIINVSSIAAKLPSPTFVYATAKAGLDHFSKCVALELASKGIRVNIVNPGPTKTAFFKNSGLRDEDEENMWELFMKRTPLGKVAQPEDIANIVLFLASDKAESITGASVVCDNGLILRGYP